MSNYVADINWKPQKFTTVAEMIDACVKSMEHYVGLEPMVVTNEPQQITNRAGEVYHSNVHLKIDVAAIEADLNQGKRVMIAPYGVMEDGTPLSGAGAAFLWTETVYNEHVRETEKSLQQFIDQTGYTARVGNKVFTRKKSQA